MSARVVIVDVCCALPVAGVVEVRCPECGARVWVPCDYGDPFAADDGVRARARAGALRSHRTDAHAPITRR